MIFIIIKKSYEIKNDLIFTFIYSIFFFLPLDPYKVLFSIKGPAFDLIFTWQHLIIATRAPDIGVDVWVVWSIQPNPSFFTCPSKLTKWTPFVFLFLSLFIFFFLWFKEYKYTSSFYKINVVYFKNKMYGCKAELKLNVNQNLLLTCIKSSRVGCQPKSYVDY